MENTYGGQRVLRDRNILREKHARRTIFQISHTARTYLTTISLAENTSVTFADQPTSQIKRVGNVNNKSSDTKRVQRTGKHNQRVESTSAMFTDEQNSQMPLKRGRRANSTSSAAKTVQCPGKRNRRAESTSTMFRDEQNSQTVKKLKSKNTSMTFNNIEVNQLIVHTCKITNEKAELKKRLSKLSERLKELKEELTIEERNCNSLESMLYKKKQHCEELQNIINA